MLTGHYKSVFNLTEDNGQLNAVPPGFHFPKQGKLTLPAAILSGCHAISRQNTPKQFTLFCYSMKL